MSQEWRVRDIEWINERRTGNYAVKVTYTDGTRKVSLKASDPERERAIAMTYDKLLALDYVGGVPASKVEEFLARQEDTAKRRVERAANSRVVPTRLLKGKK